MKTLAKIALWLVFVVVVGFSIAVLSLYLAQENETADMPAVEVSPDSDQAFYTQLKRSPGVVMKDIPEQHETAVVEAEVVEEESAEPVQPSETKRIIGANRALLSKNLGQYDSLRQPAIANPSSPENRALVRSMVTKQSANNQPATSEE